MLHFERQKLDHDFITTRGSAMDEVIKSLSMCYYVNDKKIREAIADIIRRNAIKGNVINLSSI